MHIEIPIYKDYRIAINILYKRLSATAFDIFLVAVFKVEGLSTV